MTLVNILPQDAKVGDIFTGTYTNVEGVVMRVTGPLKESFFGARLMVLTTLPYTHFEDGTLTDAWKDVIVQREEPSPVEQFAKLEVGDRFSIEGSEYERVKLSDNYYATLYPYPRVYHVDLLRGGNNLAKV